MPRCTTLVLRRPNRSHLRFNLINRLTGKNNEGFGSGSGSKRVQRTYKKRDRNKISFLNCLMFSFEGWMVLLYLERLDEDPGWRKFKLFKKYNIHLVSPVKFQTIVGSCLIKEYGTVPVLMRQSLFNVFSFAGRKHGAAPAAQEVLPGIQQLESSTYIVRDVYKTQQEPSFWETWTSVYL